MPADDIVVGRAFPGTFQGTYTEYTEALVWERFLAGVRVLDPDQWKDIADAAPASPRRRKIIDAILKRAQRA